MKRKEIDYGVLSEVSRDLNCNLIGDCSGTTISRRTTKGFKKAFNLDDRQISDQDAEHIVHIAMVGMATCFVSRNNNAPIAGFLLLASLFIFYQNGE